jgi:hypothetical protein
MFYAVAVWVPSYLIEAKGWTLIEAALGGWGQGYWVVTCSTASGSGSLQPCYAEPTGMQSRAFKAFSSRPRVSEPMVHSE